MSAVAPLQPTAKGVSSGGDEGGEGSRCGCGGHRDDRASSRCPMSNVEDSGQQRP